MIGAINWHSDDKTLCQYCVLGVLLLTRDINAHNNFIVTDTLQQWQYLKAETVSTQQHAFAAGTVKNIYSHWKSYLLFCKYFGVSAVPVAPHTLACFIQFMARHIRSYQTLCSLVSHVRLLHACFGIDFHPTQYLEVRCVLAGLRRIRCVPPSPKLPITPQILLKWHSLIDWSDQLQLVCWTMFLVAFFSFLRKSNLIPDTLKQVEQNHGHFLRRKDILLLTDSALLKISSSKTDNFGENMSFIPLAAAPNNPLCPVQALKRMVLQIPAKPSDPAFMVPLAGGQLKPLTYPVASVVLKFFAGKSGLELNRYSTHSFRRGGCSFAHEIGLDSDSLKIHGMWKSVAYQNYLKPTFAKKLNVSKVMLNQVNGIAGNVDAKY